MKPDSQPPRVVPVLVPMPADRPYSYSVAAGMQVGPGSIVRVPLGPRQVAGVHEGLAPDAAEPYNGRGVSYLALGDEDNAFADFNTAIKLDEDNAEGWANQALVYERRGDKARARKSYQQAVKLDPNYGPAVAGLDRTKGS